MSPGKVGVTEALAAEIEARLGLLPNLFDRAPSSQRVEHLWSFARTAYLDNPLPSLFKERLFVHLSRFCPARYCIVRHAGYLTGSGRPSGDRSAPVQTIAQLIALIRRPARTRGALNSNAERRLALPPGAIPASETQAEANLFDMLAQMFLQPSHGETREAVRRALGDADFERVTDLLAYVRLEHERTLMHPDIGFEADVHQMLDANPALADLLLDTRDAAIAAETAVRASAGTPMQPSDRETDLARVLRIGEVGGIDIDVAGGLHSHRSPEYLRLHGLGLESEQESHADWLARVHPDDRDKADRVLFDALAGPATNYDSEYRIIRPSDCEVRWIHARAEIDRSGSGQPLRLIGAHVDVTEQKRMQLALHAAEERQAFLLGLTDALRQLADPDEIQEVSARMLGEHLGADQVQYGEVALVEEVAERTLAATERAAAEEALRKSEDRFRRFGDASRDVLWMRDARTMRWVYLTPAFESVFGMARADALDSDDFETWKNLLLPEDRERAIAAIEKVRAGASVAFDYRIRRPDGEIRWLRNNAFPITDAAGKVVMLGGIGHDVTPLKEAEKHQKLLLAELQHRVRNTLAVIRSIVRRTAEQSKSLEENTAHLEGRINAFARVQAVVTRDPTAGVDLASIVADELRSARAREGENLTMAGASLSLDPKAAETIGLAVHELTTNAVKYGALATRDGHVRVEWHVEEDCLVFRWIETGLQGLLPSHHKGFGSEILERTLPYELKAIVSSELLPTGLRYETRMPLRLINRRR